ncbi:MAG: MoaD/ThiS family protein [Gammaproteobacteria bacterium]
MSIKIRFFASLAETVGYRETACPYAAGLTVESAWREVTGQETLPSGVMCAVNHSYCEPADLLHDEDEVAYFPPVTGG